MSNDGWRDKPSVWDIPTTSAVDVWSNPTAFAIDTDIPVAAIRNPGGGNNGGAGRNSLYKPEYDEIAKRLCDIGATDFELAQFFGVNKSTIYYWKNEYPSFNEACQLGKTGPDSRVENSLYHRAVGYSFDARKFFNNEGEITTVEYVEHVPPDTKAAHIWLLNRRPDKWREKVEHSGTDGGPIQLQITSTDAKL